jgi:hypothetical protein
MSLQFNEIPHLISGLSKEDLIENIYNKYQLVELSLKDVCNQFFRSKQLLKLADIKTINNNEPYFKLFIGRPDAYNYAIINAHDKTDDLTKKIKTKFKNYREMMVDFYTNKFDNEDEELLKKSFLNPKQITLSLFLIDGPLDEEYHLIGSVTFLSELEDPFILLSWIGVTDNIKCDNSIHVSLNDENKTFQKNFNIGSFLTCTCQLLQSIIKRSVIPIFCQVHVKKDDGPINFYYKLFFNKLNESEPSIKSVVDVNDNYIIKNDDNLVWMACFYPLYKLFLFDIIGATDAKSLQMILETGYRFF